MRRTLLSLALVALAAAAVTAPAAAQESAMSGTTMVGGQAMYPNRNIVENAVNSADHTTLVKLVKAAGLVETLEGKGPFTVFAPVNSAFDALPPGTAATLLKPENKATLAAILTYHVVAGTWNVAALRKAIADGHGSATLHTVNGGTLTAKMNGPMNIVLVDAKGNVAHITTYDVRQSNGVIQVIDRVLMPAM